MKNLKKEWIKEIEKIAFDLETLLLNTTRNGSNRDGNAPKATTTLQKQRQRSKSDDDAPKALESTFKRPNSRRSSPHAPLIRGEKKSP